MRKRISMAAEHCITSHGNTHKHTHYYIKNTRLFCLVATYWTLIWYLDKKKKSLAPYFFTIHNFTLLICTLFHHMKEWHNYIFIPFLKKKKKMGLLSRMCGGSWEEGRLMLKGLKHTNLRCLQWQVIPKSHNRGRKQEERKTKTTRAKMRIWHWLKWI